MTIDEDFKKPINIVFLLLTIGGILLSLVLFYNSRKIKSVSYSINEPASLIYDSHNKLSAIKVVEKDSLPINANVYLLTGVVWNNGDFPITKEDIRQNLTINFSSAKKILSFKILKQIDSSIAFFNLTKSSNKSLTISWKYFDPGYAFKFQVIYTGNEIPGFELNGKILGVEGLNKIGYVEKFGSLPRILALITLSSMDCLMLSCSIVLFRKIAKPEALKRSIVRRRLPQWSHKYVKVLLLVAAIYMFLVSITSLIMFLTSYRTSISIPFN